jgi:hypothetical protein
MRHYSPYLCSMIAQSPLPAYLEPFEIRISQIWVSGQTDMNGWCIACGAFIRNWSLIDSERVVRSARSN